MGKNEKLTILVAPDSLKSIEEIVPPAIEMASFRGGRIITLITINVSKNTGPNWKEIYETIKKEKADPMVRRVNELCDSAGVKLNTIVRNGNPGKIIQEVARKEGADIVVVKPISKENTLDTEKIYELFGPEEGSDLLNRMAIEANLKPKLNGHENKIASDSTDEMAELLFKMNQNADSLSQLLSKIESIIENQEVPK